MSDEQDHVWCASRGGRRTGLSPGDSPPKDLAAVQGTQEFPKRPHPNFYFSDARRPPVWRACLKGFGVARRKATPMTLTTRTLSRARTQRRPAVVTQGTGSLTFVDKVNNRPTASVYPFKGRQTAAESRTTTMTRTTLVHLRAVGRFVDSESASTTGHRSSYFYPFFSDRRLEGSLRPRRVCS